MPTTSERAELLRGLRSTPKRIPASYLYDARGSLLYQQITQVQEYYPYKEEYNLFRFRSDSIAPFIPRDSVLVELGCGDASKTCILLQAVARLHGSFQFAGIDVSQTYLDEAQANITTAMAQVQKEPGLAGAQGETHWFCADYMEGLRQVSQKFPDQVLVILWLGSSAGNLRKAEASAFFRRIHAVAGPRSRMLLAVDTWKSPGVLRLAYDDPKGVTAAFIKNGLRHALNSLGCHVAEDDEALPWSYEVVVNHRQRRVEMWLVCREETQVPGHVSLSPGERILVEVSRKFTPDDVACLAQTSGFVVYREWSTELYGMHLLASPGEAMKLSWQETDALFGSLRSWDATPIEFRHPFAFYYGHMAAFAALKLVPARGRRPFHLDLMYSQGMDPQLLEPSKCHDHPEVPAEWPQHDALKRYVAETRSVILQHLTGPGSSVDVGVLEWGEGEVMREMWRVMSVLEHDWMHQETLGYMKAQDEVQEFLRGQGLGGEREGSRKKPKKGAEEVNGEQEHCTYSLLLDQGGTDSSGSLRFEKPELVRKVAGQGDTACTAFKETKGPSAGALLSSLLPESSMEVVEVGVLPDLALFQSGRAVTLAPLLDVLIPPGPVALGVGVEVREGVGQSKCPRADVAMEGEAEPGKQGEGRSEERKREEKESEREEERETVRFAWDNEGPAQPLGSTFHFLMVSSSPVTVGDFHCFITCRQGYSHPEFWLADDWLFLQKHGLSCPATWALGPGGAEEGKGQGLKAEGKGEMDYWVYCVEERSVDRDSKIGGISCVPRAGMRLWREVRECPVFVSLAEAEAYCKAVGGGVRVMTEEEWNRIVQYDPELEKAEKEMDEEELAQKGVIGWGGRKGAGNSRSDSGKVQVHGKEQCVSGSCGIHRGSGSKGREHNRQLCPHMALREHQRGCGVMEDSVDADRQDKVALQQLQRSVRRGGWEWTSSEFAPFPGFNPDPIYPEYSLDFFDGLHFVLKGSSPVTHPAIVRDSFRNYFQRQYPFVFAKFRCCKTLIHAEL